MICIICNKRGRVDMIRDVTGIKLRPGWGGRFCSGNGEHFDRDGELIECCCDECDYYMRCFRWELCRHRYTKRYFKDLWKKKE